MTVDTTGRQITVSVVVPVFNSSSGIQRTLDSLVQQTYPRSAFEIIVVDNRSTDDTCRVVEEFITAYSGLVHLYHQDEIQSSYAARNTGIKHARGEIIAFVDADIWMERDWLNSIVRYVLTTSAQYVGCCVEVRSNSKSLASLYDRVMGFPVSYYIAKNHFAPTAFLAITKELLEQIGEFDSSLVSGGDCEFGNRVHDHGFRLHYASDIVVYHPARTTLRELIKKNQRIGKGIAQMCRKYPHRYGHLQRRWPQMLTPPDPIAFAQRLRLAAATRNIRVSMLQTVGLYAIAWLTKCSTNLGYIRA